MAQATAADVVRHIAETGGATVTLHGRRYIMGDVFDYETYVVGGAVNDEGRTYSTTWADWSDYSPEGREMVVSEALDAMKSMTALHHYAYMAGGFWLDPMGQLVVDLVETYTLRPMALAVADERGEHAIYALKAKVTIWTPKGHEWLMELAEVRGELSHEVRMTAEGVR